MPCCNIPSKRERNTRVNRQWWNGAKDHLIEAVKILNLDKQRERAYKRLSENCAKTPPACLYTLDHWVFDGIIIRFAFSLCQSQTSWRVCHFYKASGGLDRFANNWKLYTTENNWNLSELPLKALSIPKRSFWKVIGATSRGTKLSRTVHEI